MTTTEPAPDDGPTHDQLQLAYRHLWHQGWPATLDAAMAVYGYRTAILGVARNMHRRVTSTGTVHKLPKLPAPPMPKAPEPKGPRRYGRSEYSLATGPTTAVGTHQQPKRFDARKAAANDLDD